MVCLRACAVRISEASAAANNVCGLFCAPGLIRATRGDFLSRNARFHTIVLVCVDGSAAVMCFSAASNLSTIFLVFTVFGLFVCVSFRSCPCAYVFAQGDEGIVGLSYQYKDDTGNMVAISRGKVKDAKRQFAHQVQLRLCMQCNPNISVKVFKTGRLQIAGCKDEGTCNKIVRHVINCLNNIYHHVPNGHTVFERHVCEPSGQHVAVNGPIVFSEVLAPETVNINCTFDAGYSFVGYTVDPLLLRQIVSTRPEYAHCVKSVEYTPEKRYAGVKILFKPPTSAAASGDPASAKREVFIGIFPSSKTVITGAVNWAEVDDAYDFASRLLLQNFEVQVCPLCFFLVQEALCVFAAESFRVHACMLSHYTCSCWLQSGGGVVLIF